MENDYILDDKFYNRYQKAPLLVDDCRGCCQCCIDMGESIVLDPYDIFLLTQKLNLTLRELLESGKIGFHQDGGLMLPNLKMQPKKFKQGIAPACSFLNDKGRCEIHDSRPGICRLFPLGRDYSESGLKYFVLKEGCEVENRGKVEIRKWLAYDNMDEYEKFLIHWHDLRKQVRSLVINCSDDKQAMAITSGFINLFYLKPYEDCEFYQEYYKRADSII